MSEKLSARRAVFLKKNETILRQKVLDLLDIEMSGEKINLEPPGVIKGRTYDLYKYQILRKGKMPVPYVVVPPETKAPKGKVEI